jgi:ribonucleoside-diphosphate reductase alpha chain
VNLPREATPADVADVYRLAWELKCKGITVYRYGSREGQVLCLPEDAEPGSARECAG